MLNGLKVICVDDHPLLLDAVCGLFSSHPLYSIVGRGNDAFDIERLAASCNPDLIIVDFHMPGQVLRAVETVLSQFNRVRIIVYTADCDAGLVVRCLNAGVKGFVGKDSLADELIEAAQIVSEGKTYISRKCAGDVVAELRGRATVGSGASQRLTNRESQVGNMVTEAKSNKEIANALKISDKTVKHHMTNLMEKLGARNRVEVALALQRGQRRPAVGGIVGPRSSSSLG